MMIVLIVIIKILIINTFNVGGITTLIIVIKNIPVVCPDESCAKCLYKSSKPYGIYNSCGALCRATGPGMWTGGYCYYKGSTDPDHCCKCTNSPTPAPTPTPAPIYIEEYSKI
tara:strand:+ start:26 stop:364 length:339 start_codon:yes stop_codon:yes gene_type:complete